MNLLIKFHTLLAILVFSQCTKKVTPDKDAVYLDFYQGKSWVFKDGVPLDIRGVSGCSFLREAKEAGANVIRTWDEQNTQAILDSAFANQLYVMLGIYIPESRGVVDFNDEDFINEQIDRISEIVLRYKDHPALLIWAVGNEVQVYPTDYKVWKQLNRYIRLTKSLDEKHPVTTMIAPFRKSILYSKLFLGELDFLSVNCFGQIVDLGKKLNAPVIGWTGPVMLSEWGTNGPWEELEKTKWGALIEKNSTTKAAIINDRYNTYLKNNDQVDLLGSFIFYWGYKHQYTDTWFSIFSAEGAKSQVYYTMKGNWKGGIDDVLPPEIEGIHINNKSAYDNILIKKGDSINAKVGVVDSEPDSLKFEWRVSRDNIIVEEDDRLIFDLADEEIDVYQKKNTASFSADLEEGAYRLYVEIYDQENNFGYANIPFYVLE